MKPGSDLPSYLETARSGELHERVRKAVSLLSPCRVCPHKCKVDRDLKPGYCSTGSAPSVAAWTPHFGEEPPLSGTRGSGTVFLRGCNLRCVYCQNHQISQPSNPDAESLNLASNPEKLAEIFLELQQRGCHNLNWVSPSHQVPQLLQALELAIPRGLRLPIVYNTNAYDSLETLGLLDGIVDIYLPDLKYFDSETALEYSRVADYPARAHDALREMYRQLGTDWIIDRKGCLQRGLLCRLLVLPNRLAEVDRSLEWLASELSPHIGISLMAQYHPEHLTAGSDRYPLLSRSISHGEWERALASLETFIQSDHCFIQDYHEAPTSYRPDFSRRKNPFPNL